MAEVRYNELENYINKFYKNNTPELIITKRINESLQAVIVNNTIITTQGIEADAAFSRDEIDSFLLKENTVRFIQERQPFLELIPGSVVDDIQEYFSNKLSDYNVLTVYRKSNHREDGNLYSVLAQKKNGEYSCWTSWNDNIKSLNFGHYGLSTRDAAEAIIKEQFHDITGEFDKYGFGICKTTVGIEEQKDYHFDEMEVSRPIRRRGGR